MSKITRVLQKLFGSNAGGSDVGVFGSKTAGDPTYSSNPATIQSLSAFLTGFAAAVDVNGRPYMEDMNGLFLVAFRQLAYLFQAGIPEYDADTTYYTNSYVQVSGVVYYSLQDDNIGNSPASSPTYWALGVQGITTEAPGVIKAYGGSSAPTGYLLCDGTSYLRASYPELFTAIGTSFGTVDGTHFNVPDLRGVFLRGRDGGAGIDPDASSRTALKSGGNTGDNVGSYQADAFKAHIHYAGAASGVQSGPGSPELDPSADTHPTTSTGGNETRGKNVSVNYIIKT